MPADLKESNKKKEDRHDPRAARQEPRRENKAVSSSAATPNDPEFQGTEGRTCTFLICKPKQSIIFA
ncbi:hypothetical protein OROMI_029646 [Orobanche minor]